MPPRITSVIVEELSHALPQGKPSELHEFHVVVRIDGGDEGSFRLRTLRGTPLRLMHFGSGPRCTVESVLSLLDVGNVLELALGEVHMEFRNDDDGFQRGDRAAINPKNIKTVSFRDGLRQNLIAQRGTM